MKEKLKNKGLIIGIVVAVIAIVAILCVALLGKPSYKKQIKKFAEACESEEKMEKYVKKYVNLRAYYAMQNSEEPKDMDEEYKKAKKKDYKDDDFVEEVVDAFKEYTQTDKKIKVEDIGKLEKIPEDEENLLSIFSDIKGMKVAECTLKSDDEELKCYALFYEGKMLMIMPDIQQGIENSTNNAKENSAKGTANDALSTALSSIATSYYVGDASTTAQKRLSDLDEISDIIESDYFIKALEELMPDYDFEEAGEIVRFSNDEYEFEAELSDQLTIRSFNINEK